MVKLTFKWIPGSCKPDSVTAAFRTKIAVVIHSSTEKTSVPAKAGCDVPGTDGRAAQFPISSCIGLGLPCPLGCPCGGRLLPHLFTLAFRRRRYVFCGTSRELVFKRVPPAFVGNPTL